MSVSSTISACLIRKLTNSESEEHFLSMFCHFFVKKTMHWFL